MTGSAAQLPREKVRNIFDERCAKNVRCVKRFSFFRLTPPQRCVHARNESRGAHYKPDFPDRDDANWLKTTRAKWVNGDIQLTYEPVDISQIAPRPRRYDAAK